MESMVALEKEVLELTSEEVNVYEEINYQCGEIQYHCVTDCPFKTPFINKNY